MPGKVYDWVIDFWSSKLPTDSFSLKTMNGIKNELVLAGVLNGKRIEKILFVFDQSYNPPKRADNTSVTQKKWVTEVK